MQSIRVYSVRYTLRYYMLESYTDISIIKFFLDYNRAIEYKSTIRGEQNLLIVINAVNLPDIPDIVGIVNKNNVHYSRVIYTPR